MYNPGDAKIESIQPTFGRGNQGTERVMRVRFTVRGHGPYTVDVPQLGYDPKKVEQLVIAEATKITDTLDLKL